MKKLGLFVAVAMCIAAGVYGAWPKGGVPSEDEQEIRALENRYAAAFKARDVTTIMSRYAPGKELFVFDMTPPRRHVGFDDYKKDWEDLFAAFSGPVDEYELTDLDITASGNLAYGHNIQRAAFTAKDGSKFDLTVRVTDVYHRMNGKWLIIQEHVSLPVDLASGKPDLSSKPYPRRSCSVASQRRVATVMLSELTLGIPAPKANIADRIFLGTIDAGHESKTETLTEVKPEIRKGDQL